jgi:hypothetical protein
VINVKNNNLINGLFAALLLVSPWVDADQKYPASDFQPAIVYQDEEYIAKSRSQTAPPEPAVPEQTAPDTAESNKADTKYPAADFQPKVLYNDANYKHEEAATVTSPAAVSSSPKSTTTAASEKSEPVSAVTEKSESAIPNYLIGLVGLALAGVFLFRRQLKGSVKKVESSVPPAPKAYQGLTGVAKYLNRTSGTGVSRYLEKHKSSAAVTGVARYMAKQVSSAKSTAAGAATGVEKYMRNRG